MERDPFDKDTFESPIFDDARSDNLRLFGIVWGSILDRLVGRARAAPYQFIAAGISVLIAGIVALTLSMAGAFGASLWNGGTLIGSAFLLLGIAAIMSGVVANRKGPKTR
jgi:hypothetical protein